MIRTPNYKLVLPALMATAFLMLTACDRSRPVFSRISPTGSKINFANNLEERKHLNILYYLYYYNGGGVATGDINNDGLTDVYFTANSKGNNKLYLNKGDFLFDDITSNAGVAGNADWCSGVTMADVNSDGFLDIYVSAVAGYLGLQGHNQLYINNGNGTFSERSAEYGLDFSGLSTQAAFFDYDHDGDLDCYLLNHSKQPHANIVDTMNRRRYDSISGDRLYRNESVSVTGPKQYFTDVSKEAGIYQSNLGYGLGLAIADINNDGWEDIYVGNDFHENDYYYVNRGNGSFSEEGAKHFRHYSRFSMGNDAADINNDGHLDIITVDMLPPDEKTLKTYGSDENPDIYKVKLEFNGYQQQYSRNCLQINNGNGSTFRETGLLSGISATDWSWSPLFADFDNDGNKDLLITSGIVKRPVDLDYIRYVSDLEMKKGMSKTDAYDDQAISKMPDGSSHPFLFRGDGKMFFTDESKKWGLAGKKGYYTGASYADLDNDGDLDIIMNCINSTAEVFRNNTEGKNYLSISFKDSLNTFGVGCKAYVFYDNRMQYQQLMLTRGFQSSCEPRLNFGLDSLTKVDSILVVWPDQKYTVLKNDVKSGFHYTFNSVNAAGKFDPKSFFNNPKEFLEPAGKIIPWTHKENDFFDYNVQYLIPHAQSTRGPKMAVADVNGDGLDDFYVCGASGQPGLMMIQQRGQRKFMAADTALFNADAACEDVDAIFFDANKDDKPDLYVVSGGNQFMDNDNRLQDRLYINDGKGRFSRSISLPSILKNKSCVAAADVDQDGDMDLFTGVLADPVAFGIPQTSYLLLNDGNGSFSQASENIIALKEIGIVTDAGFADLNNDNLPDLIVVGEWMSIHVFLNRNGRFEKTVLPGSTGLWQSIFVDDVNEDGNQDLLVGNWGLNNKFWSGKNGPARLYVADFDKNGKTEQLLSYTVDGVEYPFLAKDEVERPLPLLKKHYLYYAEYAGVPMKDVFYGWVGQVEPYECERLGSVVCYGDGKGGFRFEELPYELQLAPIFSFQKFRHGEMKAYAAGGNFFDVIPYEGRYDSQPIALFSRNSSGIMHHHQPQLAGINGQVRDLQWIRTDNDTVLLIARNNDSLLTYRQSRH